MKVLLPKITIQDLADTMYYDHKSILLKNHMCIKCNGLIYRTYRKNSMSKKLIINNECIACGNEIKGRVLKKYRRNRYEKE